MKTCLAIAGGVGCLSMTLLIILAAIFITQAVSLKPGATAYIDRAVPAIAAHWDVQQLLDRATPKLQQYALHHHGKLERLFKMFRALGKLKYLGSPTYYKIFSGTNRTIGTFAVPAKFAKGAAQIDIQLLKTGKAWKINSFYITSSVFLPLAKPQTGKIKINPPPVGTSAVEVE